MKWEDNELDDLAKKATAKQTFQYDPAFFTDVETQLYPEKGSKKGIWITFTVIALLGCVAAFFMFDDPTQVTARVAKTYDHQNSTISYTQHTAGLSLADLTANNELLLQSSTLKTTPLNKSIVYPPAQKAASNSPSTASASLLRNELALVSPVNNLPVNNRSTHSSLNLNTVAKVDPSFRAVNVNNLMMKDINYLGAANLYTPKALAPPRFQNQSKGMFVTAAVTLGSAKSEAHSAISKSIAIGAGYAYIKGYWGFSAAILGELQRTELHFQETSRHFSYDVNTYENRLDYSSFYKLQIPLWVHFQTGKNNIQAGVSVFQLVQSKLDYQYSENGKTLRNETIYGENKGLRKAYLSAQIGYGLALTPRLIMGVNVSYDLTPQIARSTFEQSTRISPWSGQIYLRHNINR